MDKLRWAYKYVELFPEHKGRLDEHIKDYGELLGHVFFGDLINERLYNLIKYERELETVEILFDFINEMFKYGDDDCKNIIEVTILEYLGDDDKVLKRSKKYLSPELIALSDIVEESLGRKHFE